MTEMPNRKGASLWQSPAMVNRYDLDKLLRELIATLEPGTVLPTQTELRERWGADIEPMGRAVTRLVDEGVLTRRGRTVRVARASLIPRAEPASPELIEERAQVIMGLRRSGLHVDIIEALPVEDRVTLASTGDPVAAYRRTRTAVEVLQSPHADVIRSALGMDARTWHTRRIEGRRAELGRLLGRRVSRRDELVGARELAGFVESLVMLQSQGMLDLRWPL